MAVLVTGGAGYIGSHMVLALRDRGEEVVVLDNLFSGFRWAVPDEVPLVVGDAGDVETVAKVLRAHDVDAIVHFAARIVVPESVADPLGYYLANTVKTRALLAAAVGAGVAHVVFSSTAAVYGEPASAPVSEDAPLAPVSPYGASKLMSETMLRDATAAYGLRHAILRYFNVAGADPRGRSGQSTPQATHLIKVAVQTALGARPAMQIFGDDYPTPDGTCVRDYIHVADLIAAHVDALTHLRGGGASLTCNVGYGRGYSVREVVDAVRRVAGVDFRADLVARRPGDPAVIVASNRRARETLGWRPALDDLPTIVEHALAWERRLVQRGLA
jgi:UDP-glucose 4-epimerase